MNTFLQFTQIDGRRIALNANHIIAFAPRPVSQYDPEGTAEGSYIHTTVGADRRGWSEWSVIETFDQIAAVMVGAPA